MAKPRVGILGGGQLGMMLAEATATFPVPCEALDASEQAPASRVIPVTRGEVGSADDVVRFGRGFDIVTIEVEKVSVPGMRALAESGVAVRPQPDVVATIQDKGTQKAWLVASGFLTSDFEAYDDAAALREAVASGARSLPFVQKVRREGYDGRGVHVVREAADLEALLDAPCIAEDMVAIAQELAVIVGRGVDGATKAYDPVEMVFREGANILDVLLSPARVSTAMAEAAQDLACRVAEAIGIVGVIAVEMFVDGDGELWVNELAPRPHNSGHHTIEACATSQYEQHLRAITGHPLGSTEMKQAAVLVNVLGAPGHEGTPVYLGVEEAEAMGGVHVHLYGKQKTWGMRKMGHVTVLDDELDRAIDKAHRVRDMIRVEAEK